jgi:hypothetical protein
MRTRLGGWLLLAALAGSPAAAQLTTKEPERLFRARETLDLTLIAPFNTLFKNRDTINKKPEKGTLVVPNEAGPPDSLPVTLETRGHFRLRSATCRFTPLKVIFDKSLTKETPFKGQGSLKLTTHCQSASRYEQNVLVEELVYRMYNHLTPLSHRTRLAKIKYIPSEDTAKAVTKYAFFLEDDDEMAKRNGGVAMTIPGMALSDMDPPQLDLVSLFLYMIGNHDWSIYALHNMRIVQVQGYSYSYPVAYDFDFSGMVNAPYAGPPPQIPVKSLRERLYRGACRKIEELTPTLQLFHAAKDSILDLARKQPDLEEGRVKDVVNFLEGFFDRIDPPKDFDGAMGFACR